MGSRARTTPSAGPNAATHGGIYARATKKAPEWRIAEQHVARRLDGRALNPIEDERESKWLNRATEPNGQGLPMLVHESLLLRKQQLRQSCGVLATEPRTYRIAPVAHIDHSQERSKFRLWDIRTGWSCLWRLLLFDIVRGYLRLRADCHGIRKRRRWVLVVDCFHRLLAFSFLAPAFTRHSEVLSVISIAKKATY